MNHDSTAPDASAQEAHDAAGPFQAGIPSGEYLPSPGLAAMTRRYIDGEISLSQLLSFNR